MEKHYSSLISQVFGKFASKEFSPWFQKIVNGSYVNIMGLDMYEFMPASHYKTLNRLFTRDLREPRPFDQDASAFISPCDSLITECGDLDATRAMQIKGMSYCVNELLGEHVDEADKARVAHGQFINFYLSPKDYHRYHIPTDMKVLKAIHIPGKLYPVNMPSLNKRVDLFIENERVVLECETAQGKRLYMILVGALNVGKMVLAFDERIKTNADAQEATMYEYDDLSLKKGDDFGCFEMGSTIVIITEPQMLDLNIDVNEKVRFAQTIATLK